jgi:hypothetical protein
MNDHDEAHLMDGAADEPYDLELWAQRDDFDAGLLRHDLLHVFDQWRRSHDYMFVKQRDDDDWRELRYELLAAVGLTD